MTIPLSQVAVPTHIGVSGPRGLGRIRVGWMTCWHERTAGWKEEGRREEGTRIIYIRSILFHWYSVSGKGVDSANIKGAHGIWRIFSIGGTFAEVPQILNARILCFQLFSGAITNSLKIIITLPMPHLIPCMRSRSPRVGSSAGIYRKPPLQYPDLTHLLFVFNLPSRSIQERFE